MFQQQDKGAASKNGRSSTKSSSSSARSLMACETWTGVASRAPGPIRQLAGRL